MNDPVNISLSFLEQQQKWKSSSSSNLGKTWWLLKLSELTDAQEKQIKAKHAQLTILEKLFNWLRDRTNQTNQK